MAEKFCGKWRLPRHFWVLLHAVKHDMGQTALLPLKTFGLVAEIKEIKKIRHWDFKLRELWNMLCVY
jgi:hypothetical protein